MGIRTHIDRLTIGQRGRLGRFILPCLILSIVMGPRFLPLHLKTVKRSFDFMKQKTLFILLSCDGIYGYIMKTLSFWGIKPQKAGKSGGGSWYIKLVVDDTPEGTLHIRISDHDSVHEASQYDFDIVCGMARNGRRRNPISYIRFLEILGSKFGKEIPGLCKTLLRYKKQHAIELQYNRKHHVSRINDRLYVA